MDKKKEDLEQRVNPYAAPCRETKEIEKLHASMANCDRLKWFYRGLAGMVYFAPVISYGVTLEKRMYGITRFIDENFTSLSILSIVLEVTCLYAANIYKNKGLEIFGKMMDFEEKKLSRESLE